MPNLAKDREKSTGTPQFEAQLGKRGTVVLVLISVTAAIAADQLRPGWGRSVGTTVAVFAAAFAMWPQFRAKWWFWATLLPTFALQSAILWHFDILRAMLEEATPVVWGMCTLLDFVCVATAVVLVGLAATKRNQQ